MESLIRKDIRGYPGEDYLWRLLSKAALAMALRDYEKAVRDNI